MPTPATLYIDTEFNGYQGDLISVAIVDRASGTFYASLGCPMPVEWVAKHVMPALSIPAISLDDLQGHLRRFLSRYPDGIHVVADWPEDIAHFCQLLIMGPGQRIDTPPLTMEVRRDLHTEHSRVPHNALHDAIAMRDMDIDLIRTRDAIAVIYDPYIGTR